MQTSAPGNRDIAPTFGTGVSSLPPKGANFWLRRSSRPWGGPAKNCHASLRQHVFVQGFTLLELLLVVAIIAIASAGVSFALRDSGQTQLEREAQRLAALFESARARSLTSGVAVRWRTTDNGFVFEGLPAGTLPQRWLSPDVGAAVPGSVLLGPEPIIGPQAVRLVSLSQRGSSLTVGTDGVRPFTVQPVAVTGSP